MGMNNNLYDDSLSILEAATINLLCCHNDCRMKMRGAVFKIQAARKGLCLSQLPSAQKPRGKCTKIQRACIGASGLLPLLRISRSASASIVRVTMTAEKLVCMERYVRCTRSILSRRGDQGRQPQSRMIGVTVESLPGRRLKRVITSQ